MGDCPDGPQKLHDLRNRAAAASNARQWPTARRTWQRVLATSPADPRALLDLGLAQQSDASLEDALRSYRWALCSAVADADTETQRLIRRWLGKVLLQLDRPLEAREQLSHIPGRAGAVRQMYVAATRPWLHARVTDGMDQESILDIADHTKSWFDHVPERDTSIKLLAGRPPAIARDPLLMVDLDQAAARLSYERPPLYLACYRNAILMHDGSVVTSRGNLVAETVYVAGGPALGPRPSFHRKAQLTPTPDGRFRRAVPTGDYLDCPYPVLSLKTSRTAYGAWLTTQLPRLFAKEWIGLPDLHVHTRRVQEFGATELLGPLGLSADRLIESTSREFYKWRAPTGAVMTGQAMHCDCLFVSNYPMYEYGWAIPETMAPLQALRDHFAGPPPDRRRRIYVSRSDVPVRILENDDEIYACLKPLGFEFVVPSHLSWADKIRTFADAEIVVGPNGSGLYNALFSRVPEPQMVVLLDGFDNPRTIFLIAELVGAGVSYIRAHGAWSADALGSRTDTYRIEPAGVLQAVAMAIDRLAGNR